jgi:hypothetical protein
LRRKKVKTTALYILSKHFLNYDCADLNISLQSPSIPALLFFRDEMALCISVIFYLKFQSPTIEQIKKEVNQLESSFTDFNKLDFQIKITEIHKAISSQVYH